MNIVLIGYRGTGKSDVSKVLGQRLGLDVISTDTAIESRLGMAISEFVEAKGWEAFRDVETEVVLEAARAKNVIIDTGGGAILREENRAALKNSGRVVWLTASPETIQARIADDTNRPSLTDGRSFVDEVAEILAEREPTYAAAADLTISTENRSIEAITDEVIASLESEPC